MEDSFERLATTIHINTTSEWPRKKIHSSRANHARRRLRRESSHSTLSAQALSSTDSQNSWLLLLRPAHPARQSSHRPKVFISERLAKKSLARVTSAATIGAHSPAPLPCRAWSASRALREDGSSGLDRSSRSESESKQQSRSIIFWPADGQLLPARSTNGGGGDHKPTHPADDRSR